MLSFACEQSSSPFIFLTKVKTLHAREGEEARGTREIKGGTELYEILFKTTVRSEKSADNHSHSNLYGSPLHEHLSNT